MKIHAAIIAAMADIAKTGIAKASKNKDQGYYFRGIEDAMNDLSPILTRHGITVTPAYSDLTIAERPSKSGGTLRFVTVRGSFTFSCDVDSVTSYVYGEAMDSSDKAVTKAQSVAFRTALFQQFVVPTMAIDHEIDSGATSRAEELEEVAMTAVSLFDEGKEVAAYELVSGVTDNEEKLQLWGLLRPHSKLRSAIKRMAEADRTAPTPP